MSYPFQWWKTTGMDGYVVSEDMKMCCLYFVQSIVSLRDNHQFCSTIGNLQTSHILHP